MTDATHTAGSSGWRSHPRLVWFFAATEVWDRISFQGMQAILTLYLAEQLLLPGREEQQTEQETGVERETEMPRGHRQRARDHRTPPG